MSGIGLITSWLPVAFAIFLTEIRVGFFQEVRTDLHHTPQLHQLGAGILLRAEHLFAGYGDRQ